MDLHEKHFYIAFGRWVRLRRRELGMSREKFGELIGLSSGSVGAIEAGRQRMVLHQYLIASAALGKSIGAGPWILTEQHEVIVNCPDKKKPVDG